MRMANKVEISEWFMGLQDRICTRLEELDGSRKFEQDLWERSGGGGGRTRVIKDGALITKGGVNYSAVHGPMPENVLKMLKVEQMGAEAPGFYATGVSIVLHPKSPMVPIIHMNVRYFEMSNGTWWFGGGIDLTPHYVDEGLGQDFHQQLKETCDKHHINHYPAFKKWADDYFYIKHRAETRGIGGIFFDRLKADEGFTKADRWAFVQDIGDRFIELYAHQVAATRALPYGEEALNWQRLRRGRYVEFNLVWDRGTHFGLQTGGRTESILMSLPPQADWAYAHTTEVGSREAETLGFLKKDIDWVKEEGITA